MPLVSYDDEIFVGNCHKWKSDESEEIRFNKRPPRKSCFTSLKKLRYEHTTCKKVFEENFAENLFFLESGSGTNKIYSLFGKISVICCDLALYQCNYLHGKVVFCLLN